MRILINGRYWTLKYGKPTGKGRDAECDHPTERNRKIVIDKDIDPANELETLIHEMLHASDTFLHCNEGWTAKVSRDIAKVLTRLGWTRKPSQ